MAKNPENSNNVSEKFQNRIKQIVDEQEFDKKDFQNSLMSVQQ